MENVNLEKLAANIAPYLRGLWRFNQIKSTRKNVAILSNDLNPKKGLVLFFEWGHKGKVRVAGLIPSFSVHKEFDWSKCRIGFTPSRSAKSIAADIEKRLLFQYLEEWENQTKYRAELHAKNEEKRQKIELARRFFPFKDKGRSEDKEFFLPFGEVDFRMENPRLRLNLSYDMTIKLFAWLQNEIPVFVDFHKREYAVFVLKGQSYEIESLWPSSQCAHKRLAELAENGF